MDLFLKTKGLTHFFKVIWYAKSENQCLQAENGILLSLFACFQDGRQNHTESYIVVDSLLMYLRIFVGVLCWFLFYYASICVLSIFVNTLTRKRMIFALL